MGEWFYCIPFCNGSYTLSVQKKIELKYLTFFIVYSSESLVLPIFYNILMETLAGSGFKQFGNHRLLQGK